MKRVFNYNTGKLYESDGTYTITVTETPLDRRVPVDPNANGEIDEKYFSYDEALDSIYMMLDNLCDAEDIEIENDNVVETKNGVIVTVPGYKKWTFVISGDMEESISEDKSENDAPLGESVSKRFSRLRSMFEAAGLNEDDEDDEDDEKSSDDNNDNSSDEGGNDENGDDENNDEDNADEDDEEKEMKAVVITVKKGDEDKCKEELIDAGVAEDDIDVLEGDDDDENVDIRIDVNSIYELKDYLEKKGIDLEDEIGGEIVSDDDEDEEENGDSGDEVEKDKEGEDGEDFNFDDLGDLFGADEE